MKHNGFRGIHFLLFVAALVPLSQAILPDAKDRLDKLRAKMAVEKIDAFIIPSEDEHQSEYVSNYDKKREWISGFTGSAGVALVTATKAGLWSDSRYTIRAKQELDMRYWFFMEQGMNETMDEWLVKELKENQTVARNAKVTSINAWKNQENNLVAKKIIYKPIMGKDFIDDLWTNRTAKPNSTIIIHDLKYAGKSVAQKLSETMDRIKNVADLYVVTALDDVAWLFNLRGRDIPYNPMFFAYAIVNMDGNHSLYIDPSRINDALSKHLTGIKIRPYDTILGDITQLSNSGKTIWVSPMSSYAVLNAVTNKNKLVNNKASPIRSLKSVKNNIEIATARECQIRDSAARIKHMYWLEKEMEKGSNLSEISVADKLEEIQKQDPNFYDLSFDSISAVGPNAADVHYSPSKDKPFYLSKDKIYMLDAGALYYDCTTDITRTHHFGNPTEKEILAYTLVLQGSIELADMVFPPNTLGRTVDIAARAPLWNYGLDYGHGTGHGIGYFLSVHEAPPRTTYNNRDEYDEPFKVGMFQSDEPGYYEEGQFGIRLETDIEVVQADTEFVVDGIKYLKFETQSLVPFDKKLINTKMLTKSQVNWLNTYYKKIRDKVGPKLKSDENVYKYMTQMTEPFVFEQY